MILKVIKNHKNKHFGYYTEDDIMQEAAIIALENIGEFQFSKSPGGKDVKKALESWLNVVLSTRLANLYRDKFIVPQRDGVNKKASNPSRKQMFNPGVFDATIDFADSTFDLDLSAELLENLRANFTVEELILLECEMNGECLPQYYRNKLKAKMVELCRASHEE